MAINNGRLSSYLHMIGEIAKLTCFSNKSLFADRHVTKYLVKFRNEPKTSKVKCSRDERCNINEMTRNPRFCIICCCTVCDVSTNSQMKPKSLELQGEVWKH